jgi:hypothetical protein
LDHFAHQASADEAMLLLYLLSCPQQEHKHRQQYSFQANKVVMERHGYQHRTFHVKDGGVHQTITNTT